jgi:hypothetical protein
MRGLRPLQACLSGCGGVGRGETARCKRAIRIREFNAVVVSINQLVGQQQDALDANASWPAKLRTNCARRWRRRVQAASLRQGVGAAGSKACNTGPGGSAARRHADWRDALRAGHVVSQLLGLARQSGRLAQPNKPLIWFSFATAGGYVSLQAAGQVGVTLSLSG